MRIHEVHSRHRNDYTATMICEHCSATERDNSGYDDVNYHRNVIPAMHCASCGKNRAGEKKP